MIIDYYGPNYKNRSSQKQKSNKNRSGGKRIGKVKSANKENVPGEDR